MHTQERHARRNSGRKGGGVISASPRHGDGRGTSTTQVYAEAEGDAAEDGAAVLPASPTHGDGGSSSTPTGRRR
jgi:hypothetical protein